ncbi:MAG: hypothetical protein ACLQUY_13825 [Ktedonobacterales bacterium]
MMKRAVFIVTASSRIAVGLILVVSARIVCRMEIHGIQHARENARAYLAISHKRDLDTFGPVFPVLSARGWNALTRDVRFAMRGDAFASGFLSRMVVHPRWLSWSLRPVSIRTILRGIGLYPLHDLRIRPAEEWVREQLVVEGDALVGDTLSREFIQYLSAASKVDGTMLEQQPLSSLLIWRYHTPMQIYWGSEIFTGTARRHAEQRVILRARNELDDVASWLHGGGSLYGSPEGKLSPDGRVSRISSGFHRVLRAAPSDTGVVPIAIIYDFMTSGRLHMFVEVAPAIPNAPALSRLQLDRALQAAWRRNMRFTCTQLASGFMVRTAEAEIASFTLEQLVEAVVQQATALAADGRLVDERLLLPRQAQKLARRYLQFAERRRLIRHSGENSWSIQYDGGAIAVRPGDVGYPVAPLTYAWNELQDMLGDSLSMDVQETGKEIAG